MNPTDVLKQLKQANQKRCPVYGLGGVKDISIEFNAIQLSGEAGELMNAIKKKLRGDVVDKRDGRNIDEVIADELADIVICADLLSQRLGIDLQTAVVNKFNETSDKIKSDIKIWYY